MRSINVLKITVVVFFLALAFSCEKNTGKQLVPVINPPVVRTKPATDITSVSAVSGGEILHAVTVNDKGIIWDTDSSILTVTNFNKVSNGSGTQSFTDTITGLSPNSTYYIRAFADFGSGVVYGRIDTFTTLPPQTNIYVAGYHGASAAYWKNGKLFSLPSGTYAHSIFVVGDDVYVAGEYNDGRLRAVYWKNGTPVFLTDGANAAVANSIVVAGSDVYVGGYELFNNETFRPVAKYWKNGVPVHLTNGTEENNGIVYSLQVVGSDVYAAGFTTNNFLGSQVATLWKNGTAFYLSDSTNSSAAARSLFVEGSDVYVAGFEKPGLGVSGVPVAKYWKNGVGVALTDGTEFAGAWSICVTDGDVYAAGYEYQFPSYSIAKYWKNGTPISLTNGADFGNAYAIQVIGDDVYIAGGEGSDFNARLWKNGAALPLEINTTFSRSTALCAVN